VVESKHDRSSEVILTTPRDPVQLCQTRLQAVQHTATNSVFAASLPGWTFAFFNSKAQEERKARIERVNEQLRSFYGPLLACVSATKSAYNAMVRQHSPEGAPDQRAFHLACLRDPEGPQATAYRWVAGRGASGGGGSVGAAAGAAVTLTVSGQGGGSFLCGRCMAMQHWEDLHLLPGNATSTLAKALTTRCVLTVDPVLLAMAQDVDGEGAAAPE
jgi:hypothetical protein